jgi:lipoate-protein ligase A
MAVDEVLLLDAADNNIATLRFYRWTEPTLSLGYFQRYDDRYQHESSRSCAIVRRQTGGGAILHDREITYSIALPASHPFARHSESLYVEVHDAFIAAIADQLSAVVGQSAKLRRNEVSSTLSSTSEPFMCFERRAVGDVVFVPAEPGRLPGAGLPPCGDWKVLGSAQRRSRGALLQHGSLLLAASPAAPELPGLADLTSWNVTSEFPKLLADSVQQALKMRFFPAKLPPQLQSKAGELANNKYGSAAWTKRR